MSRLDHPVVFSPDAAALVLELGVRSPGDAAERLAAVDLQGLDIRAAG